MKITIFFASMLFSLASMSQDKVLEDIGTALEVSSAKELVKYMGTTLKVQIGESSNNYNRGQAEQSLRAFFRENEAENFDFVHRGSTNGSVYQLGRYTTDSTTYRVYLLLKPKGENYYLSTISFSKE